MNVCDIMSTKKLINSPEFCVDDAIEGFVCLNHDIISYVKEHRIVVRKDIVKVKKSGQVTLLSGGGAGHEPAHAGFVGNGMLSAAISGDVFSSPPSASILAAIRLIGKDNDGGCLLIVKNYTGDKLNFGLAMGRARLEGIKVDMVVVGEDCAFISEDKSAGRRGLCGTVLIHKIAGAMAETGRTLEEIVEEIKKALTNMGTIGVSLSSCTPPGSSPTFHTDEFHIELGLGIHGEPGIATITMKPLGEVISEMLDRMTMESSSSKLSLSNGVTVALIINNLGGLSQLEMYNVVKECLRYLDEICVNVCRVYFGHFMTSLDMRGVSLTLLHVDSSILDALELQTTAPSWPKSFRPIPPSFLPNQTPSESCTQDDSICVSGLVIPRDSCQLFTRAIESCCSAMITSEDFLNSLDCKGGDGDCGSTFSKGAKALEKYIGSEKTDVLCKPAHVFTKIGQIVEQTMGGTSGALYSIFFTAIAAALIDDKKPNLDPSVCICALKAGLEAVMKAGGAKPGDRTMVDSLHAAFEAADAFLAKHHPVDKSALIAEMIDRVESTVESTKFMKPRAGRASYVTRDKVDGHCDPGATAVLIWLKAIKLIL